ILYRAVAGRHVFGTISSDADLARRKLTIDATPLELARADKLAKLLIAVVMKALKRRPSERYKTAQELLEALLPLRDLARIAQAELDSTTVDQSSGLQVLLSSEGAAPQLSQTAPATPSARGSVTPTTGVTPPALSQARATQPSLPEAPPARRGMPGW